MNKKRRILFDIETIRSSNFEDLDESRKKYLLKAKNAEDDYDEFIKMCINLYPFTAEIACIALINVDERNAGVYYRTDRNEKWSINTIVNDADDNASNNIDHSANNNIDKNVDDKASNKVEVKGIAEELVDDWLINLCKSGKLNKADFFPCETEEEILENFWKVIECYEQFITFNGRGFDCPFIHHRSAIRHIVPTINLVTPRFKGPYPHCDLLDELTYSGATRKFNLDFYCQSLGVESPKSHGVSGYDMNELYFDEKRYEDIAKYCLGDVIATSELFLHWDTYLNPIRFKTRK